jgi:AP-3 complex subunit delta
MFWSNPLSLRLVILQFGQLAPFEPRLVKKLHSPMMDLIGTTPAISLLYECVRTCIIGGMLDGPSGHEIANTCVTKLSGFLEDADQNCKYSIVYDFSIAANLLSLVKYIALLALVKIAPTHPHLMSQYQDVILASIGDSDMTIRLRALDLLCAMVDSGSVQAIVQQLLSHLLGPQSNAIATTSAIDSLTRAASGLAQTSSTEANQTLTPAYRLDVAKRILKMCDLARKDGFDDLEWLLSVYVDLAYVSRVNIGAILKDALMQAVLHDSSIHRHAVKLMSKLLNDDVFLQGALESQANIEVLSAAAWICGEFCQ